MKTPEVDDQKKKRAKIKKYQILYFICWTLLWSIERGLEYWIVANEQTNEADPNNLLLIAICAANLAQLVLEMVLFIHLITVLCKMNKFLKSFEQLKISERELKVLHRSKAIFFCFTINLGLMMIIDSIYSIFSPYLWLSDILKPN